MLARLGLLFGALLVAALAAVFALFNAGSAPLDFYFFRLDLPLGLTVLLFALLGFLLGSVVLWLGVILPQGMSLRSQQRELARLRQDSEPGRE